MPNQTTTAALPPRVAELILEDERLTADLEDAEAEILLRWVLATAGEVLAAYQQAGVALDHEDLATAVQPVRRLARAINDLVAECADREPVEFLTRLLAVIDSARQLDPGSAAQDGGGNSPPSSPPADSQETIHG